MEMTTTGHHHEEMTTTMGHHHEMDPTGTTDPTGSTGHHMEEMGDMGSMSMMKMYFHMDYLGETVLFQGWKIHDVGTLILTMVGIFLISLLYEALKFSRIWLVQYVATTQVRDAEGKVLSRRGASLGSTPFTFWHFVQTILHVLQTFISYLLMLVFMTFNGWLCIAIIAGAGLGYFAFGWRTKIVIDSIDSCHH